MLEKSGQIVLSPEEYLMYESGELPPSLAARWDIKTFEELKKELTSGQFTVIEIPQ